MKAQRPQEANATLRVKTLVAPLVLFLIIGVCLALSIRDEGLRREEAITIARCEGAGGVPALIDEEAVCLKDPQFITPPRREEP